MYVIAGASGHVGSVVAGELLSQGIAVTVLLRNELKAEQWEARGALARIGLLEDSEFVSAALVGADGCFVLQPPSYGTPNFLAAQRTVADSVATAVKESGVPHVVLLSSVGAHLQQGTGPIQGQYYFEQALMESGSVSSALRCSYFHENIAHALGPAQNACIFVSLSPAPDEPFPHIACEDIGRFAASTLLSPPSRSEVVNLLGPAYSNREVAQKLGVALGRDLKLIEVPRNGWVAGLRQAGMSEEIANLFAEMYDALANGWLKPAGGRHFHGATPIEQTIEKLLHPDHSET